MAEVIERLEAPSRDLIEGLVRIAMFDANSVEMWLRGRQTMSRRL